MQKLKYHTLIVVMLFIGVQSVNAQQNVKIKEKRFVYQTSVGFSAGIGEIKYDDNQKSVSNNMSSILIHQLVAYQFNNYFYMGIGTGINIWKKTAFIPLYVSFNVNMLDKMISPHWYLNAGYSFKWYVSSEPQPPAYVIHGASTGLYGETGIGAKVKLNDRVAMIASFNYILQQSKIGYSVQEPDQPDISTYATNRAQNALYHFLGAKINILY